MATTADPSPLTSLEVALPPRRPAGVPGRTRLPMGYQPGLDGLRAVSVIAVILYHLHALGGSGFGWFAGGFFGVEVFFVVSGYLITSLLLEEHERDGGISFARFWSRRARRLLPALFTMLAVVTVWAALWRPDTIARLRTDLPGALLYYSNWLQIFDDVGYFAALDTPPLLRHLWSLAVEEQWYLVWPLVFAVLMRSVAGRTRRLVVPLVGAGLVAGLLMFVLFRPHDADRANLLYLATFTRMSGLLLGAALATVWTPWRWSGAARRHLVALDVVGFAAVGGLGAAVVLLANGSAAVYRGGMLTVSVLSVVAIAAVVHPGARTMQRVFSSAPLVAIGRRSYGLYLWHWPVFVLVRAAAGTVRLAAAVALTVALSELCYRYVEEPVRRGALTRWFAARRSGDRRVRTRVGLATALYGAAAAIVVVTSTVRVVGAEQRDRAVDASADLSFDASGTAQTAGSGAAFAAAVPVSSAPSTTAAVLPRRVVLVGDSQAHSLAVNQPAGLESTLLVTNGAIEGCGVWDEGTVFSLERDFGRSFEDCGGWEDRWADAVADSGAEVALVVLGAWDVFDVALPAGIVQFDTPEGDAAFSQRLQGGIDALRGAGAAVALLEVPCMRPVSVEGAAVRPLPERGDDQRIAHLNELLRAAAEADPQNVHFVEGPSAWCDDEEIATDLAFRWDGVHVYKPGAKLVYETITPALLQIPV